MFNFGVYLHSGPHQLHDRPTVAQPEAAGERDGGLQAPADGEQQTDGHDAERVPERVPICL